MPRYMSTFNPQYMDSRRPNKCFTPKTRNQLDQRPRHDPYVPCNGAPMSAVLPFKVQRQLQPSLAADHLMCGQGSLVSYFSYDSIQAMIDMADKAGVPCPLLAMEALVALNQSEMAQPDYNEARSRSARFGCHIGQFARNGLGRRVNPLVLRLLADLSGVTLYKCDFDYKSNCCRVFLKDELSRQELMSWHKRIRCIPSGVLVAQNEPSEWVVENIHFRGHHPTHSMPIEYMRTSYETPMRSAEPVGEVWLPCGHAVSQEWLQAAYECGAEDVLHCPTCQGTFHLSGQW